MASFSIFIVFIVAGRETCTGMSARRKNKSWKMQTERSEEEINNWSRKIDSEWPRRMMNLLQRRTWCAERWKGTFRDFETANLNQPEGWVREESKKNCIIAAAALRNLENSNFIHNRSRLELAMNPIGLLSLSLSRHSVAWFIANLATGCLTRDGKCQVARQTWNRSSTLVVIFRISQLPALVVSRWFRRLLNCLQTLK
jgi:hypothetical protein